jgi:DNA-binding MarR family transcriptional regulator
MSRCEKGGHLCTQLMRIGTFMATSFDRDMAEVGLSQAQLRTFLSLLSEPISPGTVAERSMLEKATVSLVVQRMVEAGWLERLPGQNRRTHLLSITSLGREVLSKAIPRANDLADRTVQTLSDDELSQLLHLLGKLETHLRTSQ